MADLLDQLKYYQTVIEAGNAERQARLDRSYAIARCCDQICRMGHGIDRTTVAIAALETGHFDLQHAVRMLQGSHVCDRAVSDALGTVRTIEGCWPVITTAGVMTGEVDDWLCDADLGNSYYLACVESGRVIVCNIGDDGNLESADRNQRRFKVRDSDIYTVVFGPDELLPDDGDGEEGANVATAAQVEEGTCA